MGNGCMDLLRAIRLPHYVHSETRPEVLAALRRLLRPLAKIPILPIRHHLTHMTMHAFHAHKHATQPQKIRALWEIARADARLLESAIYNNNHRDLETLLERSLRTFGVKNSPFYRIMKPALQNKQSRDWLLLEREMLRQGVIVPKTVAYRFNNLATPQVTSYNHHLQLSKHKKHDYYLFVEFLARNRITTGISDRKLFPEPPLEYTRLGTPVAICRQRNTVKKRYAKLLRDSYRPVHPDIIALADKARMDPSLPRIYRRRFDQFCEKSWAVDEEFRQVRSSIFF